MTYDFLKAINEMPTMIKTVPIKLGFIEKYLFVYYLEVLVQSVLIFIFSLGLHLHALLPDRHLQ